MSSMIHSRQRRLLLPGVCALALLRSIDPAGAQPQPARVTFLTNYVFQGRHAPFFLGRDKGFYREAGFDLNIVPATGSGFVISAIDSAKADYGMAESASVVQAVARGAKAYVKGECAECHGKDARGDGPSAKDLSIKPSDLTRRPLKSGPTARDIVRTLLTGLDGTPMPSYDQVLEDDEIWDLAYWLASRGGAPETTDDERAGWHVVQMHQQRRR